MLDLVSNLGVDNILQLAFAIHGLALAIVNLTPTPKDDAWVAKGYRVLEVIAGIVSARAKK